MKLFAILTLTPLAALVSAIKTTYTLQINGAKGDFYKTPAPVTEVRFGATSPRDGKQAAPAPLQVIKPADEGTAAILQALSTGELYKTLTLTVQQGSGPILIYTANNAAVLSIEHSGKENEFIEDILFTFETIDVQTKSNKASLARQ